MIITYYFVANRHEQQIYTEFEILKISTTPGSTVSVLKTVVRLFL